MGLERVIFDDGVSKERPVDSSHPFPVDGGSGSAGQPSSRVQSVQGFGYEASVTFTRPSNTTDYTGGDVVGSNTAGAAGPAALEFDSIGPVAGGFVIFDTVSLEIDKNAVPAGMTSFRLHLYSVTPPSALLDNAVWDLASGDRASYKGYIDLGTPVLAGVGGSTLYIETDQYGKKINVPAGGKLFGYLVTNGGFTPASATVYKVTLGSTGL